MPPDRKKWRRPRLRVIDAERISERDWNRQQLLRLRDLLEQGVELIEAGGKLPDAIATLRSLVAEIDAELSRNQEAGR